jgi:hypothetical protein
MCKNVDWQHKQFEILGWDDFKDNYGLPNWTYFGERKNNWRAKIISSHLVIPSHIIANHNSYKRVCMAYM